MFRGWTKRAIWGTVLWTLAAPLFGHSATAAIDEGSRDQEGLQATVQPVSKSNPAHLLSPAEGRAITQVALQSRRSSSRPRGDCSHVVHAIYQRAGFPYRYADSAELYDGIENFRRVSHPQPGDLAVWRGHAAIMVNPGQHTFFGATSSGLRVESYDLKYWRHRGTPRFFRYVKAQSAQLR